MSIKQAIEALELALPIMEEQATIQGYGFHRPANPNDFSPDPESCTEEEIANHRAACKAYDEGKYKPDTSGGWVSPNLHILKAPWGIGSYTDTIPEFQAQCDKVRAALAALRSMPQGEPVACGSFMTREAAIEFWKRRHPGMEPNEAAIAATIDAYSALFGDLAPVPIEAIDPHAPTRKEVEDEINATNAILANNYFDLLEVVERYEKHGVTCQTYRHFITAPCAECNATPHTEAVPTDRSEKIPLLIPSNPGELTEAVRMSEAEILNILCGVDADTKRLPPGFAQFARAVEQATAARLGVKMGDV